MTSMKEFSKNHEMVRAIESNKLLQVVQWYNSWSSCVRLVMHTCFKSYRKASLKLCDLIEQPW